MKNNKGITLIALIITIIVMLILVGVTVRIVINSNLISTADMAGFKTRISGYAEQFQFYLYDEIMQDYKFDKTTLNLDSGDAEFEKIFGKDVSEEDKACMKIINGYFHYATEDEEKNKALAEIGLLRWRFIEDETTGKRIAVTNGLKELNIGSTIDYVGKERRYKQMANFRCK